MKARTSYNLLITAGGRYDYHSVYGSEVSPRLSMLYKIGEKGSFRLAYGEAFRAPNFAELYLYVGSTKVGNENLEPEKVKNYEAGMGYTFSRYLDGKLTLFFNEIKDSIFFDPVTFQYKNKGGKGETQGVEIELKSRPFDGLLLFANYSYQDTEDEDGIEIANSPNHKFNLGFTAGYGPSTLTLSTHYKFTFFQ